MLYNKCVNYVCEHPLGSNLFSSQHLSFLPLLNILLSSLSQATARTRANYKYKRL